MHIDWGQIVTHAIGFLIAVWLLKKYAWSGLLGFIEKRRQTIATSFEEIDKGRSEVAEEKGRLDKELENIEVTRREKIQEAAREAEELAVGIKDDARKEAIEAREKAKHDIDIELDKANEVLKSRMVESVLIATEKLIGEKLDHDRHNKLISEFLDNANAR